MDISIIRMKSVFLCNLWSWGNFYIVDGPRSLIDFFVLVAVSEVFLGVVEGW